MVKTPGLRRIQTYSVSFFRISGKKMKRKSRLNSLFRVTIMTQFHRFSSHKTIRVSQKKMYICMYTAITTKSLRRQRPNEEHNYKRIFCSLIRQYPWREPCKVSLTPCKYHGTVSRWDVSRSTGPTRLALTFWGSVWKKKNKTGNKNKSELTMSVLP